MIRTTPVLIVLALGALTTGCDTGTRRDPKATVARTTSTTGGGGGGPLGQARYVQGVVQQAGPFGPSTTARFQVAIPAGATRVFVGLENLSLTPLDLYAGQPADPDQASDYDASLLAAGFGGSAALEVDLTTAPGSGYLANGGVLTIAVHAPTGAAPADFLLATFFAPVGPDAREEDDTAANAVLIGKSVTLEGQTLEAGDPDHFTVQVDAGDTIDVGIDFPHAQGDLVLEVLDPTGALIARSNTSSTVSNSEWVAPVATLSGPHLIRVTGATPSDAAAYVLEVDVAP